jgi:DNA-binding response OmpR family regulator
MKETRSHAVKSGDKGTRILLVEDEKRLARSIERQLTREGYVVELAFDGAEAQEKVLSNEFEIIVLDINLPKKSGFDLLRELRAQSYATPVLILSARDDLKDRVEGLRLGADDYVVKPFEPSEFVARIESILRRSGHGRTPILQVGELVLDVVKRTVKRADKKINLSQREFALLEFLMRNKNQIVTRKRIAQQVWGYDFETGTNIVDVYVSYVRKAVDEGFSKRLIRTVRGEGFILSDT